MDEEIRRLRAEAQRLAQGKIRSQVRYPQAFRRAALALGIPIVMSDANMKVTRTMPRGTRRMSGLLELPGEWRDAILPTRGSRVQMAHGNIITDSGAGTA